ncbi:hypothetical protein [Halarcobacter ebronensis]|uniref:Uncharacterized protein n=1 Tax=Halarcobacter ebronensis TaxID=1462615 RepID=A0A4Q1AJA8_9BACT|nr:hypothetical protein [Halarcobacter ebronensis]QKF81228.1 hypothetical protein AEBR_0728 [Halarcobacter ebronensis]RXK01791.1 hypothetical protein CRV07_14645 [Halarcobacter ebronensis]
MNLILVTKTPIIEKIFTLVCAKMGIKLLVSENLNTSDNSDIMVIDEEFVNESFNSFKSHTKKLAAIVSEELPFDKARDFIINRPFLPATLEMLLKEQVEFIKDDEKVENRLKKEFIEDGFDEEKVISNYVESLADDIASDIEEESDESIVTIASLNNGGVLDNSELTKISDLLHDDELSSNYNMPVDENDWKDISSIIDDALNEVKEYEFDLEQKPKDDEPRRLILNNYSIAELKPFLQKFDQGVIDRLSNGEDVNITMCLKVSK